MPEGPECKAYAEALRTILVDKQILGIDLLSGRYATKGQPNGMVDFKNNLPVTVWDVSSKGKFIFFQLENGRYIWSTLGLTGGWSDKLEPNSRVRFKASGNTDIYFVDDRNFGTLSFHKTSSETNDKLEKLGIDFLSPNFGKPPPVRKSVMLDDGVGESYLIFSKKKNLNKTLAEILMDQSNYAGVGNYIKAEALYRAGLSPHRTGASLTGSDIKRLHKAIATVMTESYESRKPSLSGYFNLPEANEAIFKKVVYRKALDPLGNCIISEETKDRRTTYWVPEVQK